MQLKTAFHRVRGYLSVLILMRAVTIIAAAVFLYALLRLQLHPLALCCLLLVPCSSPRCPAGWLLAVCPPVETAGFRLSEEK
jgi:hypothetical protein